MAISTASRPPTIRPNPHCSQEQIPATSATRNTALAGVLAIRAMPASILLTGGARARLCPVTRIRVICMANASMPQMPPHHALMVPMKPASVKMRARMNEMNVRIIANRYASGRYFSIILVKNSPIFRIMLTPPSDLGEIPR
ncbi:MAG: hypothetical protein BWY92_01666 [Firmicutes bacterium ADurb.BinA052]|nr:MAG: hypothetical protein BWY92_01666 [Firmicutes bacterium ADurb.BinA052]